jgi:hypothetical protein
VREIDERITRTKASMLNHHEGGRCNVWAHMQSNNRGRHVNDLGRLPASDGKWGYYPWRTLSSVHPIAEIHESEQLPDLFFCKLRTRQEH